MSDLERRLAALSPNQRARLAELARQRAGQREPAQAALVCPRPRPGAKARVLLLPHAGGGAAVYRDWHATLSEELEAWVVRYPGREGRAREPLARRLAPLAQQLIGEVTRWLDERPFAVWGHSMGALIAFELVRGLHAQVARAPERLFVASYRAPHTQRPSEVRRHHTEEEVTARFMEANGVSRAVAAELLAVLRPVLEADVELCETYDHIAGPPLPCPISAYRGATDYVTDDDLRAWQAHTAADLSLRTFSGDHFFLHQHRQALIRDLEATLLG